MRGQSLRVGGAVEVAAAETLTLADEVLVG